MNYKTLSLQSFLFAFAGFGLLCSCSVTLETSSSSIISEEKAFEWSFEDETYVPSLDPSANRIGIVGGTERIATTNLVFYQGYDDINDDEPYFYRDLGSPEHPYGAVEARLSKKTDYLAYYLPSARVAALEEGLHSFYESERHSIFGPEEVGLYDGRYIWMNSLEGQDSLLKMMAFDELSAVPLGDEEYELVGLFERREAAVEYDLALSEERSESHYLLARLILDEEGNPLSSLSSFDRGDDIELAAAVSAYAAERRVFEKYEGLVLSRERGLEGKGSYFQAPFLSASSPFKGEGRFLPLYEIEGMTLLRETRYADGIDLLGEALPADASPDEVDPFGDALRPLFKEAWLFDEEGTDYAYFDWGKLRLSLGEARREHLSTIQSAGSL